MSRVKGGVVTRRKHKKVLKAAKGFKWSAKSHYRVAHEALLHAWKYSYRDRRNKKRDMRRLWQLRIGAASRENGTSFSVLIGKLKRAGIALDRKVLAYLAAEHPPIFKKIAEFAAKR